MTVWENERTTNDTLNRLIESHYLQQAHEEVGLGSGRGNRIVFLTRTGLTWVLQKGHLREEDVAYFWRGEGDWHPAYNSHNVAVYDVLCAFIKCAQDHPENAIDIRLDPHAPLDNREEMTTFDSPLVKSGLLPDRIFAVKYHDQVAEFYLEVDLGTEGKKRWQEKIEKYLACPEIIGQVGVFVLCVADNKSRMEALLNWSQDLVNEQFLFSSLEEVCFRYERKGKDLELVKIGNPFGSVWRVVSDTKPHALFEDH